MKPFPIALAAATTPFDLRRPLLQNMNPVVVPHVVFLKAHVRSSPFRPATTLLHAHKHHAFGPNTVHGTLVLSAVLLMVKNPVKHAVMPIQLLRSIRLARRSLIVNHVIPNVAHKIVKLVNGVIGIIGILNVVYKLVIVLVLSLSLNIVMVPHVHLL
jgi:hypothetical protein